MQSIQIDKKLSRQFYLEDPVKLAPKILGKIVHRKIGNTYFSGKIVEVEAYRGKDDPAAHSYNGKTKRTEVMFFEGGYLYVYFTYGMHYCANIVCGKVNEGAAVLIRAVEPLNYIEELSLNRFGKNEITGRDKINLTNGPAKFCKAFDITKNENGSDLSNETIFLSGGTVTKISDIIQTTRVGITKAKDLPWRFYIKNNPYISRK